MRKIPFVANSDDLHCVQASFMMIVKYFMPDFEIDWEEWSKITGFEKDKGTWALASLLWLHKKGFQVNAIEEFDYRVFSEQGGAYLRQIFQNNEEYEFAIQNTNMPAEQARALELAKLAIFTNRKPTQKDIKQE